MDMTEQKTDMEKEKKNEASIQNHLPEPSFMMKGNASRSTEHTEKKTRNKKQLPPRSHWNLIAKCIAAPTILPIPMND
jgi:hypothetical protein